MWEYAPGTNTWTQKSNYPGSGIFVTSGFAICNNIYVGSGDTASATYLDHRFWKYNTTTDVWSQVTSPPGITKVQGAAFSIGDTGYFGFGADSISFRPHNVFNEFYDNDSCVSYDTCRINTGYPAVLNNTEVIIYPNPFKQTCTITLPDASANKPGFILYDVTGKEVPANITYSPSNYILNKTQLNPGIYILFTKLGNRIYYNKLVIIH
jgi:hypothetical protein